MSSDLRSHRAGPAARTTRELSAASPGNTPVILRPSAYLLSPPEGRRTVSRRQIKDTVAAVYRERHGQSA